MVDSHKVRFEPVGIEIEVDEQETILEGAFRQGVMLMHGCKEGQGEFRRWKHLLRRVR